MPRWLWQAGLLAASTIATCELARLAALRWANVWIHTEFTLEYGPAGALLAVAVSVLFAAGFEWWYRTLSNTYSARLGLGLTIGGLMANLFEMVTLGSITDYIPVRDWRLSGGDVAAYAGGILLAAAAVFNAARLGGRSQ